MKKVAEVMLCKCQQTGKTFGIRVEKTGPNSWMQTWAFPIKDKTAQNEGFSSSKIVGNIEFSEEYPGCPYCGAFSWFHCGNTNCGKITDFNGESWVKCGWCHNEAAIGGQYDGSGIDGAGDR